ncbi:galectin-related protein-like isoform X2 [Rhinatrema bivittatum]|uniref:galectin-related protein-like isoform X2 n=1 Tax=Rhinatrema bivittatum TaxID=194408 RepID=UPI00112B43EB|nr:galectin-related protein-like isoform X2 [Rhinatrema bivittatum]
MDKMTENDRCAEVEQYFGEIKGGMKPAMRLTIMGMVTSNPRSFAVSLLCSPTDSAKDASDIGFLLAVNFRNKSVTRNAKISGKWGAEEKNIPYFPFTAGENFKIWSLQFTKHQFGLRPIYIIKTYKSK